MYAFSPDNKQEFERKSDELATLAPTALTQEAERNVTKNKKSNCKRKQGEEPTPAASARKEARLEAKARKLATIETGSLQAAAVFQMQEGREVELKAKVRAQEYEITSLRKKLEESDKKIVSLEADLEDMEQELTDQELKTSASSTDLPSKSTLLLYQCKQFILFSVCKLHCLQS